MYHNVGGAFTTSAQDWNNAAAPTVRLSLSVQGQGEVSADPVGPFYYPGTVVYLTAQSPLAYPDWKFQKWDCAVAEPRNRRPRW